MRQRYELGIRWYRPLLWPDRPCEATESKEGYGDISSQPEDVSLNPAHSFVMVCSEGHILSPRSQIPPNISELLLYNESNSRRLCLLPCPISCGVRVARARSRPLFLTGDGLEGGDKEELASLPRHIMLPPLADGLKR